MIRAMASPALRLAPDDDDGLALRYYPVTSRDGTRLQAWTNDVEGPTVLLCNGLGTNPYSWASLLDPGCGVRVVSWNHRGTGGSERPADLERVGIEEFVEDAVAVLDEANVDRCVVVGWSMGVNTAFELAVRHPHRVSGVLAVGGVPGNTFGSMLEPLHVPRPLRKLVTVNLARLMKLTGRPVHAATSRLSVGRLSLQVLTHSGFMMPVADPELSRRAVREFLTTPTAWYMHLALHSSLHERVSLRRVRVPTSFLAGKYDVLASSRDMRSAAARIPGAVYEELAATHFLPMEKPDEVQQALDELLGRVL